MDGFHNRCFILLHGVQLAVCTVIRNLKQGLYYVACAKVIIATKIERAAKQKLLQIVNRVKSPFKGSRVLNN